MLIAEQTIIKTLVGEFSINLHEKYLATNKTDARRIDDRELLILKMIDCKLKENRDYRYNLVDFGDFLKVGWRVRFNSNYGQTISDEVIRTLT